MDGIQMRTTNPADRVALRGVRVSATLVGLAQRTRVEQTFVNPEARAIEAVYTFPLPDGAAVCGFEVVTGDRVLTGTIDEADAAIERYESAVAEGHGAFMAEQDRPDVFTVRVGNLKPRQAATIRLTFVRPLEVVDGSIRLAFPTTLAPRYATDAGTDPIDAAIDGEVLNPPHVLDVPYGLTLTVDVRLGRKIRAITSPTHAVTVEDSGEGQRVSLVDAAMDREVVLSIDLAADVGTHVQVERGEDGASYLAVTFVPEFAEVTAGTAPAPAEVVFVLDCSGSMEGESIAQATAALELCLRTLNVGDTFNVCRFGSTFQLMSPEPLPYTDATLDRAVEYVRSTGADLGGTELLAPLEAVLRWPPAAGRVRTVVLLTDGQVSNEPAILALARRHRGRNRIFPFGIGPAVSTFLVNGLARATGGAAEFVSPGERIEAKVLRTFARVSSPVATDVTVDWGGAEVQMLAEMPAVFDGDVLAVYGRCAGTLPDRVTLACRTGAGSQSWSADVPRVAVDGTTVATVWARRAIQSLEEVNGVGRSSHLTAGSREATEVVRLSKAFNLLSSLTTFVAVEHRTPAERNGGTPATRRVPVMLAAGWGGDMASGFGGAAGGRSRSMDRSVDKSLDRSLDRSIDRSIDRTVVWPAPAAAPSKFSEVTLGRTLKKPAAAASDRAVDRGLPTGGLQGAHKGRTARPVDHLTRILQTQTASGGLGWDADLERLATDKVPGWDGLAERVEDRVAAAVDMHNDGAAVVATAKALLLLDALFASDRSMWTRAAEKATRYLAGAVGRTADEVVAWLTAV
jgi:Ca-activated chloride channel family protein